MGDIACKFGGTSLADTNQIQKTVDLIRANPRRRYIVLSAPGKRSKDDHKITDLLLLVHQLAAQGFDRSDVFGTIRSRYKEIAADLGVASEIDTWLDEVDAGTAEGKSRDWLASRGEYLMGRIMAEHLGATFVDAAEGIRFRKDGRLDPISYQLIGEHLLGEGLFVVPGFYGLDAKGEIRTFPRGGSDITGAIVARAVRADLYENWTDVSGFLMTDPKVVPEARPIRQLTYRELRELSYMGAAVLHDAAIFPVRELEIPINIRNTNAPDDPGTFIVAQRDYSRSSVVGIAGRKDFTTISIEKHMMNQERGFGRKVMEILESHGISYEHTPTGIDSMSVIIRDEELHEKEEEVRADLQRVLEPDKVEIYPGMAMIATVGHGMAFKVGIAGRLFGALATAGVNVRMIDQGSSEINIIVGVEGKDYEKAIRAIYEAFA